MAWAGKSIPTHESEPYCSYLGLLKVILLYNFEDQKIDTKYMAVLQIEQIIFARHIRCNFIGLSKQQNTFLGLCGGWKSRLSVWKY